jgi:hypothetical protein
MPEQCPHCGCDLQTAVDPLCPDCRRPLEEATERLAGQESDRSANDSGVDDWCTWVANEACPAYRRFVALGEGVPPPDDAEVKPALALADRVALVSFFVDRPESSWTDAEICEVLGAVEECARWISEQASGYGVGLEVFSDPLYYHASDPREHLVPIGFQTAGGRTVPVEAESAAQCVALASYWPPRLGFADIVRFFGHIERSIDADSWAVLFHPREAGRSYALPAKLSLHPCVELVVCYPQHAVLRGEVEGPLRPSPAVYAHEVLHLFGASDKYDTISLKDFPSRSVTDRDIMRCRNWRLKRLRIDPLTAAEIGWPTEEE